MSQILGRRRAKLADLPTEVIAKIMKCLEVVDCVSLTQLQAPCSNCHEPPDTRVRPRSSSKALNDDGFLSVMDFENLQALP
jgi:hypothetical protein